MNDKLIRALNNQALRDGPSKLMSDAAHEIYSLSLEVEYYQHLTELLREQTNEAYEFVRDGLCNDGLSKLLQVMDVLKSERPNAELCGGEAVRTNAGLAGREDAK